VNQSKSSRQPWMFEAVQCPKSREVRDDERSTGTQQEKYHGFI
jgi:hypothetical protein